MGDLCTTPAYGPHDEENWAGRTLPYSCFFASSSKHPTNFRETESDYSFWVWYKQKKKKHCRTQRVNGTLRKGNAKFPGSSGEQVYKKVPQQGTSVTSLPPWQSGYVLSNKLCISQSRERNSFMDTWSRPQGQQLLHSIWCKIIIYCIYYSYMLLSSLYFSLANSLVWSL